MRRSVTAIVVALGVVLVLLLSSIFVVDEREKALILQFGQIRQVREEPGLGLKIPFIQEVVTYDDRILRALGEAGAHPCRRRAHRGRPHPRVGER